MNVRSHPWYRLWVQREPRGVKLTLTIYQDNIDDLPRPPDVDARGILMYGGATLSSAHWNLLDFLKAERDTDRNQN